MGVVVCRVPKEALRVKDPRAVGRSPLQTRLPLSLWGSSRRATSWVLSSQQALSDPTELLAICTLFLFIGFKDSLPWDLPLLTPT